ncbi:putative methyltransferase NSUN7 isoform X2 [Tubulanus polymorphus]|uniref:putative methyltransferase NSUN7 isoform X2 n=1 Tax=Tubulanus polymorphus TaxID=672921 RepID=UPI003DA616E7
MPPTYEDRPSSTMYPSTNHAENGDNTTTSQTRKSADGHRLPVNNKSFVRKSLNDYFRREPCLYSACVLRHAGKVFQALRHDIPDDNPYTRHMKKKDDTKKPAELPQIEFANDKDKRRTFELAFATLKYQPILETMLDDVAFFSQYPELKEEEGAVVVTLYDFQNRKYQKRTPGINEEPDEVIELIEQALYEDKTKLNAALARSRIKANARSIDYLLPENVRVKEKNSGSVPVTAWINLYKTSLSEVVDALKDDRYCMKASAERLKDEQFAVDEYCNDVLMFPADKLETLKHHELVQQNKLIIQDWTSCLGPHTVKQILGDDADVIHVNIGSVLTTAHIGSLMGSSDSMVLGFGVQDEARAEELQQKLDNLEAKNVKLISEQFLDVDPEEPKYRGIKVIFITAECSKTAIANPIDFIVNEGEDVSILKDLSTGEFDMSKIGELIGKHSALLRHALKFPRVASVVFVTRSVQEQENESCINKAIEYINTFQQNTKKIPFRARPPVLPPVNTEMNGYSTMNGTLPYQTEEPLSVANRQQQKWLKFEPSSAHNGCFVAIISREGEEVKESAKDVLARAQARGLFSGTGGKHKKEKAEKVSKSETEAAVTSGGGGGGVERPKTAKPSAGSRRRNKSPAKRVQSTPQRISTSSASSKKKSNAKSPASGAGVRTQLSLTTKVFPQSLDSPQLQRDERKILSEHQKVIKHPMPFSSDTNPHQLQHRANSRLLPNGIVLLPCACKDCTVTPPMQISDND